MVALWILGILFVLLILLGILRVSVFCSFGEELHLTLRIGPQKITILPKPEKTKKAKPKKKKATTEESEKSKKKKLKLTFQDVRSGIPTLFESLKRGLRRTRRSLVIDTMELSIVFGGNDPAKIAQMYGWAETAVWTMMPQLERLVRIKDPYIHLDVDYNAPATKAEGKISVGLRIGHILTIGGAFGLPLVKWLLQVKKNSKES